MELKVLPVEVISDESWKSAIVSLQEYSTATVSNQSLHQACVLTVWDIGQHWAFKLRWDSRHRIPYHRNLATCIKPFGEMLYALAELITRCHADTPAGTVPFGNGAEWYAAVCKECRHDDISSGWNAVQCGSGKKNRVKRHREILAVLKEDQNPYSSYSLPQLHQLIDIALGFAKISDVFDRKYWRPFLNSYSRFVTELDQKESKWQALLEKEGNLHLQVGLGRGTVLLIPPDKTKLVLELPSCKDFQT